MRIPDGEGEERGSSIRTCIVLRQALPVDALIRFVASPDGVVTPDLKRKLPGRGVWVSAYASAVAEAVKKKAFARSLKAQVVAPDGLVELVGDLLRRDALQALSMANKAGAVIAGAAKIEGGAGKRYAALIHAADASPQGVDKLEQAVRSRRRDGAAIPAVRLFDSHELSLSLGREHVIHAALVAGAVAENVLGKARAADRYLRNEPATAPIPDPQVADDVGIRMTAKDLEADE